MTSAASSFRIDNTAVYRVSSRINIIWGEAQSVHLGEVISQDDKGGQCCVGHGNVAAVIATGNWRLRRTEVINKSRRGSGREEEEGKQTRPIL